MLTSTIAAALMIAACAGPVVDGPATTPPSSDSTAHPLPTFTVEEEERFAEQREEMVARQIEARDVTDPSVLAAMRTTPRHRFVSAQYVGQAYADHPLPIGYGQTISQPYIVALMSQALEAQPGDRVLEVGTGSGYQAAVLADMGVEVFTIEIIPELADQARRVLDAAGYGSVETATDDGYWGWEAHAPFDAIIVTAAPDHVPQPLVGQLRPGGRMVVPVGPIGAVQTLWQFTADPSGELLAENLGLVRFVPLTRADE